MIIVDMFSMFTAGVCSFAMIVMIDRHRYGKAIILFILVIGNLIFGMRHLF